MAEAWFLHQLAPDGSTEDGCHPDEAQALKDYLSQNLTPEQASHAITVPIITSLTPNSDLPRLWGLLSNALVDLPPRHTKPLVELIRAIEALPPPDMSAVPEDQRPAHGDLWSGLPGFGHQWADETASYQWRWTARGKEGPRLGDLSAADVSALQARHARRQEVEALLAVEGLAGIPVDWGYECVADALERSDAAVDFEVVGACQWLRVAGSRMRQDADRGVTSWGLDKERDLFKTGERGHMTRERWQFWVDRLSSDLLSTSGSDPAQMSSLARDTVAAIRKSIENLEN